MFESLKKKFSSTVGKLSDKFSDEEVEETNPELEVPEDTKKDETESLKKMEEVEKSEEAEGVRGRLTGIFSRDKEEKNDEEKPQETPEEIKETEEEKSGIFSFVTQKTISEKDIEDILFELEMSLLESDVALEVAEKIINSVKEDLIGRKIRRRSDVVEFTKEALRNAISQILGVET
ncbi:MAG: signal recognition particle receptor subunit alpha, partial [Methanobacterium sp.]